MEVGPTGAQFGYSDPKDKRYCEAWDGAEIVRRCVAADAEYLVLWLRDGDYAYYNSKLLPKAPGLGDRDPLANALKEAKKHDIPIISYCVVQQCGNFLQAHPEWQMRGADGSPLGRFCLNSGYLEAMKEILAEQLAYGIDGFHIDMLDQGFGPPYGCWCDTCKAQFASRFGHPMPDGPTWDEAWFEMLDFRYDSSQRFEQELTKFIRSKSPTATVDYNYHGNPPFSFEVGQRPVQHAGNGDFVTGETGAWGFSALGVSLNAEFYRAATPGRPFQVAIQRGVRMYHDQTTRPLHDMRWETLTLLAHGAFVTMIDKTAFDGRLDPVAYDRMGEVLREARKKRDHFGHTPIYDVGLFFSSKTRDAWAQDKPAEYFQSFQGAHQACAMEHLMFGVVLNENLTLDALAKFPVICLPNAAVVTEREADVFREYVQRGGCLLITGFTGQFDARGRPLTKFPLRDIMGATAERRLTTKDNWLQIDFQNDTPTSLQASIGSGLRTAWPFLVKGPATVYKPTTASTYGELRQPHRTRRQLEGKMHTEWPMSADKAVGPALLIHELGEGRVVTIAASPDYATASEHNIVETRRLFRNCVQLLNPDRRVTIDAPSNVEAVVTDDPENRMLRIHLLGYNATPRSAPMSNRPFVLPGLIEDPPMFRATIRIKEAFRHVSSNSPRTEIRVDNQTIHVVVEEVHDVLVIEY